MTEFDPRIHHRHSIRLKGYDYSQTGTYFVTLVARQRQSLFGEVANGVMYLNQYGEILRQVWMDLPRHYPHVTMDEFVIMPNHVHGIVVLHDCRGGSVGNGSLPMGAMSGEVLLPEMAQTRPYVRSSDQHHPQTIHHALPEIVRAFKSFSARRINFLRNTPGTQVWQRNYYEHIIRDQPELERIRLYIHDNPHKWAEDKENPTL